MIHTYPPRPVWLSPHQVNLLAGLSFQPDCTWLNEIINAWQTAPIDSVEAAQAAVTEVCYPQCTPDEVDKAGLDVLKALGMPDA